MISDLKNMKEAEMFFLDFMNEEELNRTLKKIFIVYWIKKGRSLDIIRENLKVSNSDIAGAKEIAEKPGVKLAIKYIEADEWANVWTEKIKKAI